MTAADPAARFPPVSELLPHRGRMLLLDEVVATGPGFVACRVTIQPGSAFLEDGRVPNLVAIEYMAQTVGAYAGLQAKRQGLPVKIGYLLGTRELVLDVDSFLVGDELRVEAHHQFGDERIGAFDCRVLLRGTIVATGCLNVYLGAGEDLPA
jgi:predicted hotdog family 3-hydroxylacyl-ACP dehydratase